ncbi:type VI secretion system tube protein Hcp [Aliiglaciecola sp. CAU 1673]|uniref:Hcp family type VI secretion system effector n=1 Tax=Aliiglaciecola sp. CAU 1673 TaxID=3032595 RepID=UPI0023D9ADA3|nr:type VI secretion system tube protein Hcp [Aliiglaciecola sp. CAU 1673]MDF2178151.1 type VI secretion system tube protein Hcp [Aliiglaciecola sp. CAU 1673]
MKKLSAIYVVAVFALSLLSHEVMAAAFMKMGDIAGEAKDPRHPGEMDVLNWHWGARKKVEIKSNGDHTPKVGKKIGQMDMQFTKYVDSTTVPLFRHMAQGTHFDDVVLTVRRASQQTPLYEITLNNVLITSISTGGTGGEDRLTENVTLNFSEFEAKFVEQKEDGSETAFEYEWEIDKKEKD